MVKVHSVASSLDSNGFGHLRHDLRVVRIAGVDVGQAVVDGVHDLVGVERRVQGRVDVLGRVAHEGAEINDLATLLGFFVWGGCLAAVVVVVATTGSGHERESQDESKELEAPALSSHFGGPPRWSL